MFGKNLDLERYAGLKDVHRPGYSTEEDTCRLVRYIAVERRLLHVLAGHMLGVPEYEIKVMLGRHLWEDAEHCHGLRKRLPELRGHLNRIEKELAGPLGRFLDEALRAQNTVELLAGVYGVVKPALLAAYQEHQRTTNPLADNVTVRLLRFNILEEEEHIAWGQQTLALLLDTEDKVQAAQAWQEHLRAYLAAAGGLAGNQPIPEYELPPSRPPFQISRHSRRDERFTTTVLKDWGRPVTDVTDRLHHQMWGRAVELTAAESVASLIYEWEGLPWEAYRDLARHCWDEIRHTLMGEAALEQEGIGLTDLPNWVGYNEHAMQLPPLERYAHLAVFIEMGYMKYPPGARADYEFARDKAKHELMAMYLDYDWADEVVHARLGRRWVINYAFDGDVRAAIALGEKTGQLRQEFYDRWREEHNLTPVYEVGVGIKRPAIHEFGTTPGY
jgi:hypothetical protein